MLNHHHDQYRRLPMKEALPVKYLHTTPNPRIINLYPYVWSNPTKGRMCMTFGLLQFLSG